MAVVSSRLVTHPHHGGPGIGPDAGAYCYVSKTDVRSMGHSSFPVTARYLDVITVNLLEATSAKSKHRAAAQL